MEYFNFKILLRKQKYSELEEEYENWLSKKGRKNDDLEVENDFMVKSILPSVAVLKHTKNRKKNTQNKKWSDSDISGVVYNEWHDRDFKNKMRLKRETFNVILENFFCSD